MGDSKAPALRATEKKRKAKPRKSLGVKAKANTPAEKARAAERERLKRLPGAVTAPPDAVLEPQPHGGALVRGGVPGNRGGYIAAARRDIRKKLLRALRQGGGIEFLAQVISGKVERTRVTPQGVVVKYHDPDFQHAGVQTALKYGLGEISSHALVNENDEVLETGVVELPMLDAPPVPPTEGAAAAAPAPSLTAEARAKALDAAAALIEAAK